MTEVHVPVLLETTVHHLRLRPGALVIDATVDGGGHAAAMLAAIGTSGRLLALDRDPELVTRARQRFAAEIAANRLEVVHSSFRHLRRVAEARGFVGVDAVLFDLGLSSFHFEQSRRGFSFSR